MARRIDIELTSTRPDGTWTWRAAGAKEPKGVLEGSILYEGAKTGDVVRAEAEFEIEGITITSVIPPKTDNRSEPQRIEIIGSSRGDTPGVTTQLVGRTSRRQERPEGRRAREDRPTRERAPRERSNRGEQRDAQGERARPRSDRPREERSPRERDGARERAGADSGRPRETRSERPAARKEGAGRSVRPGPGRPSSHEPGDAEDRKSKRLNPGHVHRQAMLDSLAPEQRPIAEQVLRGGIPAVRTALHLEREKAAAEGRPTPNTDQLVAMAEELLPRLKTAEWRDRAEAAAKDPDGISLRDLRSVVAGSDVARDDETRTLAAALREALERRAAALHEQWSQEIVKHLDENRVVRALRLSARPPEPLARLDAELSQRLTDAASEALSADATPDRWLALLEAAAASPVRRSIKPAGLPPDPGPEVKQAAFQQSGRIPALAAMLGVSIPPPPTPIARRPRPAGGPRTQSRRPPAERSRAASGEPRAKEQPPSSTRETATHAPQHEPVPAQTEPEQETATHALEPEPEAQSEPTEPQQETAKDASEPEPGPQPTPSEPERTSNGSPESAEGRDDPPVVEELGEALREPQIGDLG